MGYIGSSSWRVFLLLRLIGSVRVNWNGFVDGDGGLWSLLCIIWLSLFIMFAIDWVVNVCFFLLV